MKRIYQLIALLFVTTINSYATNYYVNGNTGNNTRDGKSVANAKKDFAFCSGIATALAPGDTVFIMNGTYSTATGNSVLDMNCRGTATKPIVFTNYQNHAPLFKYSGEPNHLIGLTYNTITAYVVINGLILEGNSVYSEAEIDIAKNQTGNCLNGTITQAKVKKYNVDGIGFYSRLDATNPANEKISHHITISNCEIHNFPGGGIATSALDYLTVENCKIYNNGWYCVDGNSGISVLQCKNTDDHSGVEFSIIVRNNITYNNINYLPWSNAPNCVFTDGNGIIIDHLTQFAYNGKVLVENNLSYDNGGGGIQFFKSENGVIRNNTLYRNGKQDGYANARGYRSGEFSMYNSTNVKFYNNIVFPIPGKVAVTSGSADATKVCENNLIASNITGGFTFDGSKNILNQDPQFVDAANGDFRIKCTSPAVNTGTNTSGLFSITDIIGSKRPNGSRPDIGAYEANCTVSPEIQLKQGTSTILNGTGTYEFSPDVAVGNTAAPITFTIQNTGNANLTIGNISISGANPFSFVVSQVTNTTIQGPSGSSTFTISYKPAFVGPKSALITIANNDPNENPYTFSITAKTTTITALEADDADLQSVNIYPNPSNDGIFNLSKTANWKVYSLTGKELKSGNGNQINLSEQPKGMYLIKMNEKIERVVVQ